MSKIGTWRQDPRRAVHLPPAAGVAWWAPGLPAGRRSGAGGGASDTKGRSSGTRRLHEDEIRSVAVGCAEAGVAEGSRFARFRAASHPPRRTPPPCRTRRSRPTLSPIGPLKFLSLQTDGFGFCRSETEASCEMSGKSTGGLTNRSTGITTYSVL